MKFKKLNVPSHWQTYWTRYPEGHTILEALIQWVSQVDSMVDNQNKLNDNVAQFRNEIDEFVGKFDERLQDEVTHTLKDWQTSGFLDVVISEALQWQLDDYIATNEQDKLSFTTQLQQTEQELSSQLAQTESVVGGDLGEIWIPPLQPKMEDIIYINSPYSSYMNLWEGLRNENTHYISRTLLGKDQSGTYDIFKYIFEPKNYEKTIILTANLHGSEKVGQILLYRFLYLICNEYANYAQLNYMRNKVRLVVIPIVNPWGLENGTRVNVNGVDINRNFQYNWNAYNGAIGTPEYKGTAPLSEVETRYVDQILGEYASEAIAYIDVHNTAEQTTTSINEVRYYCEVPMYGKGKIDVVQRVMDSLVPNGYTVNRNIFRTVNPSAYNQGYFVYGINSVTPEHLPGGKYGATQYSAEDTTYGFQFIANIILQYSATNRIDKEKQEMFAVEKTIGSTVTKVETLNQYVSVDGLEHTFQPKTNGLLVLNCEIQFTQSSLTSNNFFSLQAFQSGNQVVSRALVNESSQEMLSGYDGKPITISLSRVIPVFQYNSIYKDVEIGAYAKTDNGEITLRRGNIHVLFLPTENVPDFTKRVTTNGANQYSSEYPRPISIDS